MLLIHRHLQENSTLLAKRILISLLIVGNFDLAADYYHEIVRYYHVPKIKNKHFNRQEKPLLSLLL